VSTIHKSAPDINGGAIPLLYTERIQSNGSAHDINDRIHGSDFMEMHFLRIDPMDLSFGRCQEFECAKCNLLCAGRKVRDSDQTANLGPMTAMNVRMSCFMLVFRALVIVVMVMRVGAGIHDRRWVDLSGTFCRHTVLEDVHFGGSDPAAIDRGDSQLCPDAQRCRCLLQGFGRDACVNQRTQQHVPGDSGKTLNRSDLHS
jgi:hypothetical protein